MSRDASGVYTLPAAYNPVVTLTKIRSAWANTTLADIAGELTSSLDRAGRGGMLAGLKLYAGNSALPGLTWGDETGSGWYRAAPGDFRHAIGVVDGAGVKSDGLYTGDGTGSGTLYKVGFRGLPVNSQSAAYGCVLTDAGKVILHPSADTTPRTFTIPANASVAFEIGTALTFVNQNGAGDVTIAITSDTMRLSPGGSLGSRTLVANGCATALKITATEWIISGSGLS